MCEALPPTAFKGTGLCRCTSLEGRHMREGVFLPSRNYAFKVDMSP